MIFVAGVLAGAINSIAGGGTLVSFPTLVWLGRDPIIANATNAVALWPASLAGAFGFRRELATVRRWLLLLVLPSLAGGALGAWLLLRTPASAFERLVPLLILGATLLLAAQEAITRRLGILAQAHENPTAGWVAFVFVFQFLVALYGGYFGAGMGILMLAALGLIGLTDLHQMNGLKNVLAVCINGIAAIYFALSNAVNWHDVAVMIAGTVLGGYAGARIARRLGRKFVRRTVVVIGLVMTIFTATTLSAEPRTERERRPFPRAAGYQSGAVAATNGEDFFALWTDTRSGFEEVYGTVVRRDGTVTEPFGINIGFPETGRAPAVAWDGNAYLAVWLSGERVRMARFDANGQRLGEPRTINEPCSYCSFSIAPGGASTLVTLRGFDRPRLITLDRDGNTMHETTLPIDRPSGLTTAAFRDGFVVFALSSAGELLLWRTDASGRLRDASPRALTSAPNEPVRAGTVHAAVSDGTLLVTFARFIYDGFPASFRNSSVLGLIGDGETFSAPFTIAQVGTPSYALTTQSDGFTLAVTRETHRIWVPPAGDVLVPEQPVFDLDAYHVSRTGVVRRGAKLATGKDSDDYPALAAAGDALFVAWEERTLLTGVNKIAGAVSQGARDAVALDLARSATYQSVPAITGGIDGFLAVWQEQPQNDSRNDIMARTEKGRAFRVSTGERTRLPSVAFDGTRYLVTWLEPFEVMGRLVEVDGTPASAPFPIGVHADPYERSVVASNGDGFLVAYGERYYVPPPGTRKLYVVHVSHDAAVTPVRLDIDANTSIHGELQLQTDRFTWMLSRSEYSARSPYKCEVVVERFITQRDGASVRLPRASAETALCRTPALACTREQCAVADYEDQRVVVSLAPPNFGTVAAFPSPQKPDELKLVAAGHDFVPFVQRGDVIDMLTAALPRRVVDARLLGEFAVAANAQGRIAIAYEAPAASAFGAKRVHIRITE